MSNPFLEGENIVSDSDSEGDDPEQLEKVAHRQKMEEDGFTLVT